MKDIQGLEKHSYISGSLESSHMCEPAKSQKRQKMALAIYKLLAECKGLCMCR